MSSESFRQKIADLTRKSRQAVKLYSNVAKKPAKCSEEWIKEGLGDIQIDEWKKVNSDLHRELCRILEMGSQSTIVASVFELRDAFYTTWRKREADAAILQRDLITSVEVSQFARVVSLGYKLAAMKAQMQALHAAYEELQGILKGYSNANQTAASGSALYGLRTDSNAAHQVLSTVNGPVDSKVQMNLGFRAEVGNSQQEQKNPEKPEGVLAKIIPMKRRFA